MIRVIYSHFVLLQRRQSQSCCAKVSEVFPRPPHRKTIAIQASRPLRKLKPNYDNKFILGSSFWLSNPSQIVPLNFRIIFVSVRSVTCRSSLHIKLWRIIRILYSGKTSHNTFSSGILRFYIIPYTNMGEWITYDILLLFQGWFTFSVAWCRADDEKAGETCVHVVTLTRSRVRAYDANLELKFN